MFKFGEIWESTTGTSNTSNYSKHTQFHLLAKKARIKHMAHLSDCSESGFEFDEEFRPLLPITDYEFVQVTLVLKKILTIEQISTTSRAIYNWFMKKHPNKLSKNPRKLIKVFHNDTGIYAYHRVEPGEVCLIPSPLDINRIANTGIVLGFLSIICGLGAIVCGLGAIVCGLL